MDLSKILKVGDVVKIKTYDDLLLEYKCDHKGDICIKEDGALFTQEMANLSGLIFCIKNINQVVVNCIDGFAITPNMVEVVELAQK